MTENQNQGGKGAAKPTPPSISTPAPHRARVSFDVDGVFADFDGHCLELFGAAPRELTFEHHTGEILKGDPALWAHVEQTPNFWLDMPVKGGADELMDIASPYGVQFLTGCPVTGYDRAEREKRIKLATHWPDVHVITCRSKHKDLHMQEKGDILVDDFVANIRRWEKAGGVPIYYKRIDQAIRDLKEALLRQFPDIIPHWS